MHYKQRVRNAAGGRPHKKKNLLPLSRIITLHTHTLFEIRAQAFAAGAQKFSPAATIHGVMNVCARSLHSSSAEALKAQSAGFTFGAQ